MEMGILFVENENLLDNASSRFGNINSSKNNCYL